MMAEERAFVFNDTGHPACDMCGDPQAFLIAGRCRPCWEKLEAQDASITAEQWMLMYEGVDSRIGCLTCWNDLLSLVSES